MVQTNILSFLTSSLLLQFTFVLFLPLFLSIAGSTPEPQVIRGGVRSVSHPDGHTVRTISLCRGRTWNYSVFFFLMTHLVVIRALWLAEPSAVSIQEPPRSTYIGCAPGNCVDVHSHVFPIMSYSPAGRIHVVGKILRRTDQESNLSHLFCWSDRDILTSVFKRNTSLSPCSTSNLMSFHKRCFLLKKLRQEY